jgi:hypothetical protein
MQSSGRRTEMLHGLASGSTCWRVQQQASTWPCLPGTWPFGASKACRQTGGCGFTPAVCLDIKLKLFVSLQQMGRMRLQRKQSHGRRMLGCIPICAAHSGSFGHGRGERRRMRITTRSLLVQSSLAAVVCGCPVVPSQSHMLCCLVLLQVLARQPPHQARLAARAVRPHGRSKEAVVRQLGALRGRRDATTQAVAGPCMRLAYAHCGRSVQAHICILLVDLWVGSTQGSAADLYFGG